MIRKILFILTRKEKTGLGLLMLLDLVISIADIIFLALLLIILNHYTNQGGAGKRLSFLLPLFDTRYSMFLIGCFFLLFSAKNWVGYLIYRAQCRYLLGVATRISRNRLSHYLEGSYANYINVDTSVHIREISYHPLDFSQHVLGGFQQILTQTVLIVLAITGIILFNVQLFFLLFVILLPPVFVIFYFIRKRLRSVRAITRTSSERSLQHLQEALTGFVESNIYHKNEAFLDRYLAVQRQFNESIADQLIIQGIPNRLVEIFALFGLVILIGINTLSGNTDHSAVLTIGVFMAAAYKIIPGIVKIMNAGGQINAYAFTVDNLAEDGGGVPVGMDGSCAEAIRSVSCRQLSFSYNGQRILEGQDLDIRTGDLIGISGPSGKGKTTLLNLLLGFLEPDSGEICFNGAATGMSDRRRYRERISYVKQQSFLLHDTLLHNITLNGKAADPVRLSTVAETAGLSALIESSPEKWEKMIAENGKNISGGQRQRIAIARALYKQADLIILDEPFNELDSESEIRLLGSLQQLASEGKMIILITHNRDSLSYCNKIISLDE
ncbi:MAG TPA: ABC transporter ATP-binding protein [Puia sp.]|nr:ABC transporter ATP-binding protein [Puia sp.]